MLYINDYNDLTSKIFLQSLIGKMVTVYVDGGGKSGDGFTGILIETFSDRIRLVNAVPIMPANKANRCRYIGSSTVIMRSHITAITYNYV